MTCVPGEGYIVVYGKNEDGSLEANFLTKGTPSFEQYYIVDESENLVQSLADYDQQLVESKRLYYFIKKMINVDIKLSVF